MNKILFVLLTVAVAGCAWLDKPPDTKGAHIMAINSRKHSEYTQLHADLLHIKKALEKQQYSSIAKIMKSDAPRSRLVYIFFSNKSPVFKPSPAEEMDLLPYIKKAKNIEIRSRSDYFYSNEVGEKIAIDRALSIKQYLVARGINASIISMHYAVNNGFMDGEESNVVYEKNSPVVVELFYE